jgi:hypothetical protein
MECSKGEPKHDTWDQYTFEAAHETEPVPIGFESGDSETRNDPRVEDKEEPTGEIPDDAPFKYWEARFDENLDYTVEKVLEYEPDDSWKPGECFVDRG